MRICLAHSAETHSSYSKWLLNGHYQVGVGELGWVTSRILQAVVFLAAVETESWWLHSCFCYFGIVLEATYSRLFYPFWG